MSKKKNTVHYHKKLLQYLEIFLKVITSLAGTALIVIYLTYRYTLDNYGSSLTVEQVLWTVSNSLTGVAQSFITTIIKYVFSGILLCLIWTFTVFTFNSKILLSKICPAKKTQVCLFGFSATDVIKKVYTYALLLSFLAFAIFKSAAVIEEADRVYGISNYYRMQKEAQINDRLKKYYQVPKLSDVKFDKKKNLVLVMGESLETRFNSDIPLSPNLNELAEKYHCTELKLINTNGSNWTVGALTGWHFGLPLKLPIDKNKYYSRRGFLPNALSVFDVLKNNGYKLVLIMGSHRVFSGVGALFQTHGDFEILDLEYWQNHGYTLPANKAIDWGYSDEFVMNRAREYFEKLQHDDTPFVLLVQTIDTHFPEGYCPKEKRIFNDIRDAYLETDKQISEFVKFALSNKKSELVIGVIGDHYFMGQHKIFSNGLRLIRNSFFGDVPPIQKSDEFIGAVDMAPTILEAAGGRWNSSKFGIGTSVFSKDKSLVETLSADKYNELISCPSKTYQSFY